MSKFSAGNSQVNENSDEFVWLSAVGLFASATGPV